MTSTAPPPTELDLTRDEDWERLKSQLGSMAGKTVWLQLDPTDASGFTDYAIKTVMPSFEALGDPNNDDILSLLWDFGDGTLEVARQMIELATEGDDGVMMRAEGICVSFTLCPSDDWRVVGVTP